MSLLRVLFTVLVAGCSSSATHTQTTVEAGTGGQAGSGGQAGGSAGQAGSGGQAGGSAGQAGETGLPTDCGSKLGGCDPVAGTGCTSEQQCDFDGSLFNCKPLQASAPEVGSTCSDPANFCAPGGICDQDDIICRKVCCVSSDCPQQEECTVTPGGSFGFCKPKSR
ncbi:MAG: hypothetical protein KC776_38540 [Myxococcales bacterium]|nr:hypothetical protein [Myxococcales bacterium]MCB9576226.1 hypothetical protein [Polyangiaceae bacterium]